MPNGFFNLIKPTGMTSSDAVVTVRNILTKACGEKVKTGHFGTLDPLGAGVLPISVGRAARLFELQNQGNKVYRAGICFGVGTDTLDSAGKITITSDCLPDLDDFLQVLPRFVGKIAQMPPKYSSKSIDGKRAYDLAREGIEFELKPRDIEIYDISYVGREGASYVIDVNCSGGTYIRSLARDIASALGTVGYMSFIIRKQCGYFNLADAVTLADIEKNPLKYLLPTEYFTDNLTRFFVPDDYADKVLNGIKLEFTDLPLGDFAVYVYGKLLGIGVNEKGYLRIKTRLV